MTRAKKRLYVPLLFETSNRSLKEGHASPIELFFSKILKKDPYLEKLSKEETYLLLEPFLKEGAMTLNEMLPMELKAPKKTALVIGSQSNPPKTLSPCSKSVVFSFSSLKDSPEEKEKVIAESGLPKGAEFGIFIHKVLEVLLSGKEKDLEKVIQDEMLFYPFTPFEKEIAALVKRALYSPLKKGLILADIPKEDMQVEVEFFSPLKESHFLKGFIDAVFYFEGKYYLLDWKTNILNDYSEENLAEALLLENYNLQAAIYTDALQRFLKRVDPRPFEEIFGGMFYVFLRGLEKASGIYHFYPDLKLLSDLKV